MITLMSNANNNPRREGDIRRMTDVEFQAQRDKGLCFKCEEKYTIGHRCKAKELRALVVQANSEELEISKEQEPPKEEEPQAAEVMDDAVELSLNSVVGFTGPRTIKMKGKIRCGGGGCSNR